MNLPYMKFWVGDYLKDTMHLDAKSHGAYMLLLMHLWNNAQAMLRHCPSICKMNASEWNEIKEDILPFFQIEGEVISHSRLNSEREDVISSISDSKQRASDAAKKRWENERAKKDNANAMHEHMQMHMQEQCSSNASHSHSHNTPSDPEGSSGVLCEKNKKKRFLAPTVEEVQARIDEKGFSVDAERFWAFYESKGWMVGKNKMTSWDAALSNWNKSQGTQQQPRQQFLTAAERDRDERNELAKQIKANGGIFAGFA